MANGLAFDFLDVGQGDGTLVQFPPWDKGEMALVDFGKKSSSDVPVNDALAFLFQRITEICKARGDQAPLLDYLFISHVDGDHWNHLGQLINGVIGPLDKPTKKDLWAAQGWKKGTTLTIGTLVFGGKWSIYKSRNKSLAELVWGASLKQAPAFNADHSDEPAKPFLPNVGGVTVYVLSANRSRTKDANPDSLVLMFDYGGHKVILTGDAESRIVEPAILKEYKPAFLKCEVLKLGHHGSKASTSEDWLKVLKPEVVFASGDRRWGHPYCQPLEYAEKYVKAIGKGDHRYCCSGGKLWAIFTGWADALDYHNHEGKSGLCTNLWYVVQGTPWDNLPGPPAGKKERGLWGNYTGVQWRLEIDTNGARDVFSTDQWPWPSSKTRVAAEQASPPSAASS